MSVEVRLFVTAGGEIVVCGSCGECGASGMMAVLITDLLAIAPHGATN